MTRRHFTVLFDWLDTYYDEEFICGVAAWPYILSLSIFALVSGPVEQTRLSVFVTDLELEQSHRVRVSRNRQINCSCGLGSKTSSLSARFFSLPPSLKWPAVTSTLTRSCQSKFPVGKPIKIRVRKLNSTLAFERAPLHHKQENPVVAGSISQSVLSRSRCYNSWAAQTLTLLLVFNTTTSRRVDQGRRRWKRARGDTQRRIK